MNLRLLTVGLLGLCAFASAAGLIDNKNQASISSDVAMRVSPER